MKRIPWNTIINHLREDISEAEQLSLNKWLQATKNQQLFEEIKQLWFSVIKKSGEFNPDKKTAWEKICTQIDIRESRRHHFVLQLRNWTVAASILSLFVLSTLYVYDKFVSTKEQFVTYTTYFGKSQLSLPDGTKVWLNRESTLKYGNSFNKKDRSVEIYGEAFFRVAKNKNKEFHVRSGQVDVMVHGTVFNVNNRNTRNAIEVSLLEGSVSIKDQHANLARLKPGEMAIYQKQKGTLSVQNANTALDAIWIQNRLHFENKKLGDVALLLSNWYDIKIDVRPELSNMGNITLTVRDEPVQEILQLLQKIYKMHYVQKDDIVQIY